MSKNDLFLFGVIFGSFLVAITEPQLGIPFQPYLAHFTMVMLFLSFLRIDFAAFFSVTRPALIRLVCMAGVKLLLLPTGLYLLALALAPSFAVPILLLSAVSTGVVAPFVALLVEAEMTPVLRMVMLTSLAVPFSLPFLTKLLVGAQLVLPLGAMISLLAQVIFTPIIAVWLVKRFYPVAIEPILRRQFPIALTMFFLINLGVFSKYSHFFFQEPYDVLLCIILAYILASVYYVVGYFCFTANPTQDRLADAVSLGAINNILVVVFSSQFFGPLSPTLAAMYVFPFFTITLPVNFLRRRRYIGDQLDGPNAAS